MDRERDREEIRKYVQYSRWAGKFIGYLQMLFFEKDPRVKEMDRFDSMRALQAARSTDDLPDWIKELIPAYEKWQQEGGPAAWDDKWLKERMRKNNEMS